MKEIKKSAYSKFDDERSVAKSIRPKVEGKLLVQRILFILLYVAFVGLWLALGMVFQSLIAPVMALSLVSLLILIFFTWRYVNFEYELTIHEGKFGLAVIYGSVQRKDLYSCTIRDIKLIAPYSGARKEEADSYAADKKLVCVADLNNENNYFAIYEKDGEKVLMIFETEEKTLKMLKYYNGENFHTK